MTIQLANPAYVMMQAAIAVLKPPEDVDFLKWAEKEIIFSERETENAGRYNRKLFAPFDEIYDALNPADTCRIVTLKKGVQIGGTVVANVFTLGSQAQDPCDIMYIHPTESNAIRWSNMKLKPMLNSTASVRKLFPNKSREVGDSTLYKERIDGRGSILISGANSPASLSQVSVRRQVQDDLSKWETNLAGNPESQADSRSSAYEFAKILKISTPMINPGCRISKAYDEGTQETYHVPCPHCAHMHALEWGNMLAYLVEGEPEKACFSCPSCGGIIEEHHRREFILNEKQGGKAKWVAANPKAARYHRSFYLWWAYLNHSWESIARAWFSAKGNPADEQVFLNDQLGMAFEAKGEAPPWEEIRDRAQASQMTSQREQGSIVVVQWCSVLTVGIDVQKDRVEWQVVAWGRDYRRHVVEVGVITGHISEAHTQGGLDELLKMQWKHASGNMLKLDMAAIDGNAWTEDVWGWAKRHPASKLIMVRGVGSEQAPLIQRVKKERNRKGALIKYAGRFYNFATSVLKMRLYRNLRKSDPLERGYVGFPKDLPDEYYRQLTAETRQEVKRRDGFTDYKWVKDPNQANEMLDTMLQAETAANRLNINYWTEATWNKLEGERCAPIKDAQLDFEDMMSTIGLTSKAIEPSQPQTKHRHQRRMRSTGLQ